jgi:ankyrin repeat protein
MDLNQNQDKLYKQEARDCYNAIKNNDLAELARYAEKYGVDAPLEDGTCLHQAIFNNNYPTTEYLLKASADPDALYDNSVTPLIAAIDLKFWDITGLLVKFGADVNLKDGKNNSPLSKAIFHYRGDAGLIQSLLLRGADPYQELIDGYTPMHLAESMGLKGMMLQLIDKNNINK